MAAGKAESKDTKIDRNKQQKKEALFDSAFELFSSKGIQATTISNIAERARVAKGTFYLYFKDKYDIRDRLIAQKAAQIFAVAHAALRKTALSSFEDKVVFLADNILDQLSANKLLLTLISKNLSWGIFKRELVSSLDKDNIDFPTLFTSAMEESGVRYRDPEIMIYMILELLGSACYSSILHDEPMPIRKLKPYLFDAIRGILRAHEI